MTDALFEIEPETPKWQRMADLHGIECSLVESPHLPPIYVAEIRWFGDVEREQAETKREATIALIHRLQLTGWSTIAL